MSDGIDGEMLNKTKPYNKSTGLQGIGDTVKAMNEWNMNDMIDPIESAPSPRTGEVKKYHKNS